MKYLCLLMAGGLNIVHSSKICLATYLPWALEWLFEDFFFCYENYLVPFFNLKAKSSHSSRWDRKEAECHVPHKLLCFRIRGTFRMPDAGLCLQSSWIDWWGQGKNVILTTDAATLGHTWHWWPCSILEDQEVMWPWCETVLISSLIDTQLYLPFRQT